MIPFITVEIFIYCVGIWEGEGGKLLINEETKFLVRIIIRCLCIATDA